MGEYDQLAARAKEKDVNAFAMLYELVYEDMYHMAYYMLGNAHDAEDVVSDAVLAAFESIHKLRSAGAFKGWIFQILLNKCKRKRRSYMDRPVSLDGQAEREGTPRSELPAETEKALREAFVAGGGSLREDAGISREESLDVRQAFLKLGETERIILAMSVFGGYKSHEIGRYLRMNANTVRTKRSRALGKLHDMLVGKAASGQEQA